MSENRRLDSWKSIADYVGRTEKTVQRYEKAKDFPIHRIVGGNKERVFAYTEEIDHWFSSQQVHPNDNGHDSDDFTTARGSSPRWSRRRFLLWSILALISVLTFSFWFFFRRVSTRSALDSVRVRGNTLAALGTEGKILWEKTFKAPLQTEPSLEIVSGANWITGREHLLYVGDLNRDNRKEFLVLEGTADQIFELHCLQEDGAVRWRFNPGESLLYGSQKIDDLWPIQFFLIDDLDGDGRDEIIVNSHHRLWFPSKISVLKADGKIIGEYYNCGWVESIATRDLDGDGSREILCGGTNNEFKKGVLFVLDIQAVFGSSPKSEKRDFQCLQLLPGREKFYILFPRDCINRTIMEKGCADLVKASPASVEVDFYSYSPNANPGASIFILDDHFALSRVAANSEYLALHRHLERARILDHPFAQTELDNLDPLLYWNGERFVRTPATNSHWIKQPPSR